MFCTHCGKNNPEQAKFCFACGSRFTLSVAVSSDAPVKAMPGMRGDQDQTTQLEETVAEGKSASSEDTSSRTLEIIVSAVTYVVVYVAMRMLGAGTSISILAGTAVGLLLALPPFFIARRKGFQVFGKRSLIAGAVVGAIGGALLALPLTIILTIVASRRKSPFGNVSDGSALQFVWVCPECGRHVPRQVERCRCGSEQSSSQRTSIHSNSNGAPNQRTVAFTDPHTGEVKTVKVGWSWTCFLFSTFFGVPLFLRGLTNWGLAMVGLWACGMSLGFATSLFGAIPTAGVIYFVIAIAYLWLPVFLGVKANELTAKHYLQEGWVFVNPGSDTARLARQKWHLAETLGIDAAQPGRSSANAGRDRGNPVRAI